MAFFKHLEMRELISERHGDKGAATTRSNKSGLSIDRIWATLGRLAYGFGTVELPMRKPSTRDLRMDDEIGQQRHNSTARK
eukprot:5680898-Ditylum_brightwellii.AAC.1